MGKDALREEGEEESLKSVNGVTERKGMGGNTSEGVRKDCW